MDSLVAQVRTLAENADEAGHNNILRTLRDLQHDLESPTDIFLQLYNSHLKIAILYVAVELDIFQQLAQQGGGDLRVTAIAEKSGASPELLERLLRYLSSIGFIVNNGPNQFRANKLTHVLASPLAGAGLNHCFDTCGPAIQAIPAFLAENKYQDITSNNKTPFQKGHNTDLDCFKWLVQQPKQFDAMQKVMTGLQSSDWITGLDILDSSAVAFSQSSSRPSEKPFFVDVGGGHGHQCIQLRERYPSLHGHLVLQDLPQAVGQLSPIDGVEAVAQDFFDKQTISGAKFYYLRRILHDWPDAESVKILSNLKAVMTEESRILIDEMVLPDVDAHWHAAMGDISMGILFGGKERTRTQWEALAKQSGLRILQIQTYNVSLCNSITVLGL